MALESAAAEGSLPASSSRLNSSLFSGIEMQVVVVTWLCQLNDCSLSVHKGLPCSYLYFIMHSTAEDNPSSCGVSIVLFNQFFAWVCCLKSFAFPIILQLIVFVKIIFRVDSLRWDCQQRE